MLGMLRSAMTGEQGAAMLREFVGSALLGRVAAASARSTRCGCRRRRRRWSGVVILRHVVRLEPLASAPVETWSPWSPPPSSATSLG